MHPYLQKAKMVTSLDPKSPTVNLKCLYFDSSKFGE